jgi:hypothetical protein
LIYPFARRKCSRADCKTRASQLSSWTEVIEEMRRLMLRSAARNFQ